MRGKVFVTKVDGTIWWSNYLDRNALDQRQKLCVSENKVRKIKERLGKDKIMEE